MLDSKKSTPKSLGYRIPAEWEKQSAVWISWPHNEDTWPSMIDEVEESYVQFVKVLHSGQKIKILVNYENTQIKVANKLKNAEMNLSKIIFYQIKTADAWIRDYGPTFVLNQSSKQKLGIVKWIFNAWGNKYEDLKKDNIVPYEINKIMKLTLFESDIILEGGSIEVNGSGTLLTTEQCLLNKNRNPNCSKEELETYLKDYLNVSNILWLKEGIAGDDTDGHIDDIARFVSKDTIVCCFEENKNDINYKILKKNFELLKNMHDEKGNKLRIVKLPMPGFVGNGQAMLPASYANFYIGNEVVAVPIFKTKNDTKAIKILQNLFPTRKVVGINCRAMVHGFGTLHCCSQQEPY